MTKIVDARGFSCPQPVLMALKALADTVETVVVEVDHETAAENVERACRGKGRAGVVKKTASGYAVEIAPR